MNFIISGNTSDWQSAISLFIYNASNLMVSVKDLLKASKKAHSLPHNYIPPATMQSIPQPNYHDWSATIQATLQPNYLQPAIMQATCQHHPESTLQPLPQTTGQSLPSTGQSLPAVHPKDNRQLPSQLQLATPQPLQQGLFAPVTPRKCSIKTLHLLKWEDEQGIEQTFCLSNKVKSRWKDFGTLLNLVDEVDAWDDKYRGDPDSCWKKVMKHWLDGGSEEDYPPTWEGLYDLLVDVRCSVVAKELKKVVAIVNRLPTSTK